MMKRCVCITLVCSLQILRVMTAYEVLTIPPNSVNPLLIARQGDPACLLFNPSLTNNVWISDNVSFSFGLKNDSIPIPPLGSIVITNIQGDTYGQTDGGQILLQKSDALSAVASPSQIAEEITLSGVPLVGAPAQLATFNSQVIGPSGFYFVLDLAGSVVMPVSNYLSYDLTFAVQGSGSSTVPFGFITLTWFADSGAGISLAQEKWIFPTPTVSTFIRASGPVRGGYLEVTLNSLEPTFNQTYSNFDLHVNARPWPNPLSDWRMNLAVATVPGFAPPTAGTGFEAIVGYWSSTVAPSGSVTLIAGLYNGQLMITNTVSGTAPNCTIVSETYLPGVGIIPIAPTQTFSAAASTD